jgi:beta-N-acetylhexosaminidase
MTAAQRAGQLFLVGIASGNPGSAAARAVNSYHFGSLLFSGDSAAGIRLTRYATRRVQSLATARATAGVRFLIAANQEGGAVQQLAGPGFTPVPSALAQGAQPVAVLREEAEIWGRELKSAGVNLDLAPVLDVVPSATARRNQPIGALGREFGHAPGTVAAHGVAFIQGLRRAGVAATAKHFPGLGQVTGNTDFTSGVVDTTTTPDDPYLRSFQEAINAGVPFVMVSLATYTRIDPRHLAVFSSRVMRGLLRERIRFTGVIVSDDLGAATAVASLPPAQRAFGFLDAGGDLITAQDIAPAIAMDRAVLRRAAADPAFRAEVDAAAKRVLAAKETLGLLPCGRG